MYVFHETQLSLCISCEHIKFGFFLYNSGLNLEESLISYLNNIFFKQPWFCINKWHTHVNINSWTSLSQNMIEACIILSQKIWILCQARCCYSPISSVHYRCHHMIISLLSIWKPYHKYEIRTAEEIVKNMYTTEQKTACIRKSKSYGMWHYIIEWAVPGISKDCSAFNFTFQQSKSPSWPRRGKHYYHLKHPKLLVCWFSIISHKHRKFSNPAVRTPHLISKYKLIHVNLM